MGVWFFVRKNFNSFSLILVRFDDSIRQPCIMFNPQHTTSLASVIPDLVLASLPGLKAALKLWLFGNRDLDMHELHFIQLSLQLKIGLFYILLVHFYIRQVYRNLRNHYLMFLRIIGFLLVSVDGSHTQPPLSDNRLFPTVNHTLQVVELLGRHGGLVSLVLLRGLSRQRSSRNKWHFSIFYANVAEVYYNFQFKKKI